MTCCPERHDFCVSAGATFLPTIRWALETMSSHAITGITQAVPAAVTMASHSIPDGWPVSVNAVRGMTSINAKRYPPTTADLHYATYQSGTVITLNDVNSADMPAYTSGGYVTYRTPVDLTGVTAQMLIYDAPEDGTLLATLTHLSGITLNNTTKTIKPRINTASVTWTTGYYDLELTDAGGVVTQLLSGVITIQP